MTEDEFKKKWGDISKADAKKNKDKLLRYAVIEKLDQGMDDSKRDARLARLYKKQRAGLPEDQRKLLEKVEVIIAGKDFSEQKKRYEAAVAGKNYNDDQKKAEHKRITEEVLKEQGIDLNKISYEDFIKYYVILGDLGELTRHVLASEINAEIEEWEKQAKAN